MSRPHDEAHGLTAREAAVVARLEAGDLIEDVATAFRISAGSVKSMKQRYVITTEQLTGFDRMVRRGEARYAAALAATGKVYA